MAIALVVWGQAFTFDQCIVINTSTAVPIQLTNNNLRVRSLALIGKKDFQSTNTTAVSVGWNDPVNGHQGLTIDPGQGVTLKAIDGKSFFFPSNIWMDVSTANDGLLMIYEQ